MRTATHKPLHAQNEGNDNTQFLCPIVAADALLEIGTAVTSAACSLDEHMLQTFEILPDVLLSYSLLPERRG
jgi:hypothetical protein